MNIKVLPILLQAKSVYLLRNNVFSENIFIRLELAFLVSLIQKECSFDSYARPVLTRFETNDLS